ncbi:MAG: DsbA family protein [Rhodospirillales bacterium]
MPVSRSFFFRAAILGTALFAALALPLDARADDGLSAAQKDDVRAVIEQLLKDKPELVIEAIQTFREREEKAERDKAQAALADLKDSLANDPLTPVGGNPKGDVTLVEFFDYRCGFCKKVQPTLAAVIAEDPNLRVVYKEFPILGPESAIASQAASAAWLINPKGYEKLHNSLMTYRGQLSEAAIKAAVKDAGYDTDQVEKAMKGPEVEQVLAANHALARSLAINGTPAFIIGERIIPGAVDAKTLKEAIAEVRSKTKG